MHSFPASTTHLPLSPPPPLPPPPPPPLPRLALQTEQEFEIDINESEPLFLKGQTTRTGIQMSPIKIVKNPDGSMQRAAMTQSALAKERRELKQQQQVGRRDARVQQY